MPPPPSLPFAWMSPDALMLAWREDRLDAGTVLAHLDPLLRRLADWSSKKYALPDMGEDIRQELILALLGDAGQKWDGNYPLSSYLAGWSWRIAAKMKRHTERESLMDDPFDSTEAFALAESDAEPNAPESFAEQDQAMQAHRLVLASLAEAQRFDEELDGLTRTVDKRVRRRKRKPRPRPLQGDQRLLTLRRAVGMTRAAMATALGISLGLYAGYESGKIRTVPENIYRNAELLLANASQRVKLSQETSDLPMSEVVARWCRLVERDPQGVADMLGVSLRTMRRWLSDIYKPRQSIVVCHDMKIHEIANQARRSACGTA